MDAIGFVIGIAFILGGLIAIAATMFIAIYAVALIVCVPAEKMLDYLGERRRRIDAREDSGRQP